MRITAWAKSVCLYAMMMKQSHQPWSPHAYKHKNSLWNCKCSFWPSFLRFKDLLRNVLSLKLELKVVPLLNNFKSYVSYQIVSTCKDGNSNLLLDMHRPPRVSCPPHMMFTCFGCSRICRNGPSAERRRTTSHEPSTHSESRATQHYLDQVSDWPINPFTESQIERGSSVHVRILSPMWGSSVPCEDPLPGHKEMLMELNTSTQQQDSLHEKNQFVTLMCDTVTAALW